MKTIAVAVCTALSLVGCRDASVSPGPPAGKTVAQVVVSSAAFAAGSSIPPQYTCDGTGESPQLAWTAMPDAAKSAVLVVDDPDAPHGTFTHWIVWNIAPATRTIGTASNGGLGGGVNGTNDFDRVGYGGPCPPKGQLHHYRFTVYGLDKKLDLRPSDKRADLDRAMSSHVVAQGTLVGTYRH